MLNLLHRNSAGMQLPYNNGGTFIAVPQKRTFFLPENINTAHMPYVCKINCTVVKMCFQRLDALAVLPVTLKYDINISQTMAHNVTVR